MIRFWFTAAACLIPLLLATPSMAQQTEESAKPFQAVEYPGDDSDVSCGACGCCSCRGTSAGDCSSCSGCRNSCCRDIRHREQLFGDWLGIRPGLTRHGIVPDIQWTQFYQGVLSGGNDENSAYGGKFDYNFTFMGEQMGLGQGLIAVMHAETRHGNDIILDAAPLAPSNVNMLYPSLENETAITGLQFTQMLSPEWGVTFGKFNGLDFFHAIYPQTGRGIEGFMNVSLLFPMTAATTLPPTFLGAGVMKMQGRQLRGALLVYDSNNIATTAGFDVLFNNGANIAGMWRFFNDRGGLPGSHLFLGTYATGKFTSLDPTGWDFFPPVGVVPAQQTGSWCFAYIREQKLWIDCCNRNRNIGFLGQISAADEKTSAYEWTMNASLQAQGLLFGRDQDTMGIGYFYSGLSGDFKALLGAGGLAFADLQGEPNSITTPPSPHGSISLATCKSSSRGWLQTTRRWSRACGRISSFETPQRGITTQEMPYSPQIARYADNVYGLYLRIARVHSGRGILGR